MMYGCIRNSEVKMKSERTKPEQPEPECETYSIDETATILGIGRNQAYQQAKAGKIPVIYFGKRMVVSRVRLRRMLEGSEA